MGTFKTNNQSKAEKAQYYSTIAILLVNLVYMGLIIYLMLDYVKQD